MTLREQIATALYSGFQDRTHGLDPVGNNRVIYPEWPRLSNARRSPWLRDADRIIAAVPLIGAAEDTRDALQRIRPMVGSPHGYTIANIWQAQKQADEALAKGEKK